MSTVLSRATQPVAIRPVRSIGGLVLDVVVCEQHDDSLEITAHPVERGAQITDHAYVKPATVSIEAGHSDSRGGGAGDSRSVEAYEALLRLQRSREPFELVTGKRTYANMLIKTLSVTTDAATEHVLSVRAELQEILLATVQEVAVPRSRQRHASRTASPTQTGQKQAKPVSSSGLVQLFGGSK